MKIILNSYTGIGAWFMLRLRGEGHRVTYNLLSDDCKNVLRGLVPTPIKTNDFKPYDLSIFDITGKPRLADKSAKECPTIGDGSLNSRLESDRLFGINIMEQCGITVPEYDVFDDINAARKFVSKTKKRYVFKPDGGQDQSSATTYVSTSYQDLLEYFDKLTEMAKGQKFILQEFVPNGTEVSTNGYFNGEEFFFVTATLEEKKFLNGNLGPNTGCSGNLIWAYDDMPKVYKEGLEKLKPYLQFIGFRGPIDLNAIVTQDKLYGLEWTPRFGYDSSCTEFALIDGNLGEFLYAIAAGEKPQYRIKANFSAAVRVSIPPYPSEFKGKHPDSVPIGGLDEDNLDKYYLWDAMLDGNNLVTCGQGYGCVAVPVGLGETIAEAFCLVDKRIDNLKIPDMQYRTDIKKFVLKRYYELEKMGWFSV